MSVAWWWMALSVASRHHPCETWWTLKRRMLSTAPDAPLPLTHPMTRVAERGGGADGRPASSQRTRRLFHPGKRFRPHSQQGPMHRCLPNKGTGACLALQGGRCPPRETSARGKRVSAGARSIPSYNYSEGLSPTPGKGERADQHGGGVDASAVARGKPGAGDGGDGRGGCLIGAVRV